MTDKQITEREENYEYPPRLRIECKQMDISKALHSTFVVYKKSKDKEDECIARFTINKGITGKV